MDLKLGREPEGKKCDLLGGGPRVCISLPKLELFSKSAILEPLLMYFGVKIER